MTTINKAMLNLTLFQPSKKIWSGSSLIGHHKVAIYGSKLEVMISSGIELHMFTVLQFVNNSSLKLATVQQLQNVQALNLAYQLL
jgi:hypothetical protein